MMRARQAGASAIGAIRELGGALALGRFRIALALSALLHLGLLLGLRGIEVVPPGRPPVRLHLVREEPAAPLEAEAASRPRLRAARPAAAQHAPRGTTVAAPQPPPPEPVAATRAPMAAPPAALPAAAPQLEVHAPPQVEAPAGRPEEPVPLPPASARTLPEPVPESPAAPAVPAARGIEAAVPVPPAAAADGVARGGAAAGAAASTRGESPDAGAAAASAGAGVPGGAPAGGAGDAAGAGAAPPGPGPAGAPRLDSVPSAQEIAALRRRIDARKVYPQIAIRNGWEGRVLVEMHLDVDGRLAAVRLVAGSGYSILDEATITAVRLASPYPPVARVVTVPVEYRLIP